MGATVAGQFDFTTVVVMRRFNWERGRPRPQEPEARKERMNELKVNVDSIDEKMLVEGLQKVANRITLGLILAALIRCSAMRIIVKGSSQGRTERFFSV